MTLLLFFMGSLLQCDVVSQILFEDFLWHLLDVVHHLLGLDQYGRQVDCDADVVEGSSLHDFLSGFFHQTLDPWLGLSKVEFPHSFIFGVRSVHLPFEKEELV